MSADAPTPLDLDAILVRADARRDYADERPESLHVPEDYAALARAVAHDGPGHPYGDAAYCGGCLAEREANQ